MDLADERRELDKELKASKEANKARAAAATPQGEAECFEAWVAQSPERGDIPHNRLKLLFEEAKEKERQASREAKEARERQVEEERRRQEQEEKELAARAAKAAAKRQQGVDKGKRAEARDSKRVRRGTEPDPDGMDMSEPETVNSVDTASKDTQELRLLVGAGTPQATGFTTPELPPHPLH